MEIITILKKKLSNTLYTLLLSHILLKARDEIILPPKTDFTLITIGFNNAEILRIQHEYLKKYLEDPFDHFIADNSNDPERSEEIKKFCIQNSISYIRLPGNPLTSVRASGSHGIALNWCYRNIVQKHKPKFWGFLDHDIFPITNTHIVRKIKIGFWGAIRTRGEKWWYLWPGFCFFEHVKTAHFRFNFLPYHAGKDGSTFLDTGGSNYNTIYKKINRMEIQEAKTKLIDLNTEKEYQKGQDSSRTFEIIDSSWLHLRQIAWREESSNKMTEKEDILNVAKKYVN